MDWTREILFNDLAKREYKTSLAKRLPIIKRHFPGYVTHTKTWPDYPSAYSERLHVCRTA